MHKIATLMIAPSQDPHVIATCHIGRLPRSPRALLRVMGAEGGGEAPAEKILMPRLQVWAEG